MIFEWILNWQVPSWRKPGYRHWNCRSLRWTTTCRRPRCSRWWTPCAPRSTAPPSANWCWTWTSVRSRWAPSARRCPARRPASDRCTSSTCRVSGAPCRRWRRSSAAAIWRRSTSAAAGRPPHRAQSPRTGRSITRRYSTTIKFFFYVFFFIKIYLFHLIWFDLIWFDEFFMFFNWFLMLFNWFLIELIFNWIDIKLYETDFHLNFLI